MSKIGNAHKELVRNLVKPGEAIVKELDPAKAELLHMAVGISGEAGELLDAIKKYTMYNKPMDMDNVIEELGDLEFYMEGLRQVLRLSRETTLSENIEKLGKGYSSGSFSNQEAQERKDKEND